MTLRMRSSGPLPWWFGIPFVLGGLVFAGVGVSFLLDELRYGSEGLAVVGTVTDLDYSPGAGDSGPSYTIRYAYTDTAGVERYGATDVSEGEFDAAIIGGPVEVTYVPAEPTKSRVGSPEPQLILPMIFIAGGVLFSGIGVGLLFLVRAIRNRQLPSWVQYSNGSQTESDEQVPAALAQIFRGTALASAVASEPAAGSATSAAPAAQSAPLTEAELRALDARLAPPDPPTPDPTTVEGSGHPS